jgi:hypothetical protein
VRHRRRLYVAEFGFAPTRTVSFDIAAGARRGGGPATAGAFAFPRPLRMSFADQSGISAEIAFDHAASYASASRGFPEFCLSNSGFARSLCFRLEAAVRSGWLLWKLDSKPLGDLEDAYRRTIESGGNMINTEFGLAQSDQLPIFLHRPFAHPVCLQPVARAPSRDEDPSVSRRVATDLAPRSGRLNSISSEDSRTSPTVFNPA